MAKIPVDTRELTFVAAGPAEPVLANRETGELAVDRAGRRQWQVHVMVLPAAAGLAGEKPQMWTIKLAGEEPPAIGQGAPVSFTGLVAADWEVEGRHGLSYRAESVMPTASAAPPPPRSKAA
jgi:hypothetical protein